MQKTEWNALEVVTYGKKDYAFKPSCETATTLFNQFKAYKGIDRKTMSNALMAELANMVAMQGLEIDFIVVDIKEMESHKRKLNIGDSIIKAVKPSQKSIFTI